MIIELIEVTQAELNTAANVVKNVTDQTVSGVTTVWRSVDVTANLMSVDNNSGAQINFCPMTELEYTNYSLDTTISDLIPVADSGSKELSGMLGEITRVIVSGTAGHSAGITFVMYKD